MPGEFIQFKGLFVTQKGFDLLMHGIDQCFAFGPGLDVVLGDQARVAMYDGMQLFLLFRISIDDVIEVFFETRCEAHFGHPVYLLHGYITMSEKPCYKANPDEGKYRCDYF